MKPRITALAGVLVAVLLGAPAFGGAATAALDGSGNPNGRWATEGAIEANIVSHRLDVGYRPCTKPEPCDSAGGPIKVSSATVAGIPPSTMINGARHFQLFDVRACTIYYFRGPHRFRFHFRWFTRRPPGGTITARTRDGGIVVVRDSGEPYARDWNHPLRRPQADGRC